VESDSRLSFGTLPTPSPASNVTKLTQLNIHDNLAQIWQGSDLFWSSLGPPVYNTSSQRPLLLSHRQDSGRIDTSRALSQTQLIRTCKTAHRPILCSSLRAPAAARWRSSSRVRSIPSKVINTPTYTEEHESRETSVDPAMRSSADWGNLQG